MGVSWVATVSYRLWRETKLLDVEQGQRGAGFDTTMTGSGIQLSAKSIERLFRCRDRGSDCSIRWFAELGFEPAHDGNDSAHGTQMLQEKFATGRLRQCQLGAGMNGGQMVQILAAGGKSEKLRRLRPLETEQSIDGEFRCIHELSVRSADALIHEADVPATM
jgi:hypothetical protein